MNSTSVLDQYWLDFLPYRIGQVRHTPAWTRSGTVAYITVWIVVAFMFLSKIYFTFWLALVVARLNNSGSQFMPKNLFLSWRHLLSSKYGQRDEGHFRPVGRSRELRFGFG